MKNFKRAIMCVCLCFVVVACAFCVTACSDKTVSVVKIEKTGTIGLVDEYTIFYSDGSRSKMTISNGRDGVDGKDGENSPKYSLQDIYEQYKTATGDELSYEQFLDRFLNYSEDNSIVVSDLLNCSLMVYTKFDEIQTGTFPYSSSIKEALYTGAAVIYEMGEQDSYLVTNYHVIYDTNAVSSKVCEDEDIHAYLYGSGKPMLDSNNNYVFGDYAIDCTLVAGSAINDLAVIKVSTSRLKEINPEAHAVTLADGYRVGQTVIAIGNPLGLGISVSRGIVSVESENIKLNVDGTLRTYRSMRIDASIYEGSSGGGLFDNTGKLIGITNAGEGAEAQNVNYAVPIDTVKAVVDPIIANDKDSYSETRGLYKITLGITCQAANARYAYDKQSCSGKIVEDVIVTDLVAGSIASRMGLAIGDILRKFKVYRNDEILEFDIDRNFSLTYALYSLRAGDQIEFVVERNSSEKSSGKCSVLATDFIEVE